MSGNKGGRPKQNYTDKLRELIKGELMDMFVENGLFRIPSNSDLKRYVVNHPEMLEHHASVEQVLRVINNHKATLIKEIFREKGIKIKLPVPVFGRRMDPDTPIILDLIVDEFHTSFMTKPFPGQNANIYKKIIDRMGKFTTEKIRLLAAKHAKLLLKRCKERGELISMT